MLAAWPTTSTCSVAAGSAALKRSLAMAMASAVKVKLTSPGLLRLYMLVLPQESANSGQEARQLGGHARVGE